MMKILLLPLFVFIISLSYSHALVKKINSIESLRGGVDGGGSEIWTFAGPSAWFLKDYKNKANERSIKYCYKVGSHFPVEGFDFEELIEKAYSKWSAYIKKNQINENSQLKLEMKTRAVQCDGKEDIKFLFGVINPEVIDRLSSLVGAIGFAHRTEHFSKRGWSKGYIWLTSPKLYGEKGFEWTKERLLGTLTHEIGHTLGIGHVEGTIMNKNFSLDVLWEKFVEDNSDVITKINGVSILDYSNVSKFRLSHIDYHNRLVHYPNQEQPIKGQLGQRGSKRERELFKKFMKRLPHGKVELSLVFPWVYNSQGLYTGELTIKDDKGSRGFSFHLNKFQKSLSNEVRLPVFRRSWVQENSSLESLGVSDYPSQLLVGTVAIDEKRRETILFEYGFLNEEFGPKKGESFLPTISPYKIFLLNKGRKDLLFGSFLEL